jgi:hypothetical protein
VKFIYFGISYDNPCSPLSLSLLPAPRSPLQAHVLATSRNKWRQDWKHFQWLLGGHRIGGAKVAFAVMAELVFVLHGLIAVSTEEGDAPPLAPMSPPPQ